MRPLSRSLGVLTGAATLALLLAPAATAAPDRPGPAAGPARTAASTGTATSTGTASTAAGSAGTAGTAAGSAGTAGVTAPTTGKGGIAPAGSVPAASPTPAPEVKGPVRDARAAAGVGTDAATNAMWSTGNLAPGAVQTWAWNNANPLTAAHKVGYSPTGATSTQPCRFETVRSWYTRSPNGERKFWFQTKNSGAITCSATVLLVQLDGVKIGTTALYPGAEQNWYWNINHNVNYNPTQLAGLVPFAGSSLCQYEIVRSSVYTVHPALRQFHFTVKNVGTVFCDTDLYLANKHTTGDWSATTWSDPGDTHHAWWNNAYPLNSVYLSHAQPYYIGPPCWIVYDREYYEQRLNPGAQTEREWHVDLRNIGTTNCQHVHIEFTQLYA